MKKPIKGKPYYHWDGFNCPVKCKVTIVDDRRKLAQVTHDNNIYSLFWVPFDQLIEGETPEKMSLVLTETARHCLNYSAEINRREMATVPEDYDG